MQWWWSWWGGAYRPDQINMKTNKATIHVPGNGKHFPPDAETEQVANLQRQQTEEGPRHCGLGSTRCEPLSDLYMGKRNQASVPKSAEQGGNERPNLIPPFTILSLLLA